MYEAAALVVVALITVGGSVVTNRQARRTANSTAQTTVQGSIETSRIAAEQGAYERAQSYYEDVIDRQAAELVRLRAAVDELEAENDALSAELETAKNVLRLRFPDE